MGKHGRAPLTKEKIIEVMKALHAQARNDGVRYALIGGALWVLMGVEGYETYDIDVAATDYLQLPDVRDENLGEKFASFSPRGHYLVEGVRVDWMPQGRKGSYLLFQEAVESGVPNEHGIWLSSPAHAVAIKKYANRPSDKDGLDLLLDSDVYDDDVVDGLIAMLCKDEKSAKKDT